MWRSISRFVSSFRLKKRITELAGICHDCSETSSNVSAEDALECPICWESFNVAEHVPCVLWCGHTLCKSCVQGLEKATLNFPTQKVQIPFLISCPWCNFLTLRLVYNGNLKFPNNNFFLVWMVESRNKSKRLLGSSSSSNNNGISTSERQHMFFQKFDVMDKFPLVILLLIIVFALSTSVAILVLHLVITIFFAAPAFLVLYFVYPVLNWLGQQIRI